MALLMALPPLNELSDAVAAIDHLATEAAVWAHFPVAMLAHDKSAKILHRSTPSPLRSCLPQALTLWDEQVETLKVRQPQEIWIQKVGTTRKMHRRCVFTKTVFLGASFWAMPKWRT